VRALVLAQSLPIMAQHLAHTGIRLKDRRKDGDQGRLTAPRGAGDHEKLAATDVEVDAAQR